jgi:hypothetical protein
MSVIDKVVNEWAFRCKKGYPDMNNPDDMKILKEIYSEFGIVTEEETKQPPSKTVKDLITLLSAKTEELSPEQVDKLFNIINKTGKGYTTTLMDKLLDKKLGEEQALIVAGYADRNHFEDKMVASIDNKSNTFAALGESGNLANTLSELSGIDSNYVSKLIGFTTGAGQKGVGRGEIALVSFLSDTKSAKTGDVEVADGVVELKASSLTDKNKLTGSILAPKTIGGRGGSAASIANELLKFFTDEDAKRIIPSKKEGSGWIGRLYSYYLYGKENSTEAGFENKFKTTLQKFFNHTYGTGTITAADTDLESFEKLQLRVAKDLAKAYMEEINHPIMFISSNSNYIIVRTTEDLENIIGTNVKILGTVSDYTPRLGFVS